MCSSRCLTFQLRVLTYGKLDAPKVFQAQDASSGVLERNGDLAKRPLHGCHNCCSNHEVWGDGKRQRRTPWVWQLGQQEGMGEVFMPHDPNYVYFYSRMENCYSFLEHDSETVASATPLLPEKLHFLHIQLIILSWGRYAVLSVLYPHTQHIQGFAIMNFAWIMKNTGVMGRSKLSPIGH